MKTVFVTGAGGYVGGRAVEFLRGRGYDVVAGVRNRARKLAYERVGIRSLVCDVADPINVARAVASARPDAVLHLAGTSRAQDAGREPIDAFLSLAASCAYVLDAVRRAVPRARVVFVSAADAGRRGDSAHNSPSDNGMPRANSLFGAFKSVGETLAASFHGAYGADVSVARPYWYTGAGQPESAYFPMAFRRILDAYRRGVTEVEIPDANVPRDVMHVDDVVAAYERVLVDGKPNAVYDVCSGRETTPQELLNAATSQAGIVVRVTSGGSSWGHAGVAGAGNASRLRDELGWEAPHSAIDAVTDLWTGLRNTAEAGLQPSDRPITAGAV